MCGSLDQLHEAFSKLNMDKVSKNISLEFEAELKNIFLGRTLAGKTSLLRHPAGLMCQLFFQSARIFSKVL